jgi:DNA-binding Lrp family transcriptional regulator
VSTIRRVNRPDTEFTMIRNAFLRDGSLSFHARGLGGWLLSHTEGWECNTVGIAKQAGIGRDQVRRALRELEAARYLRRTRLRTQAGTLGEAVYEIQCEPFPEEENTRSNQRLENQALDGQGLARLQHKKNTSKNTNEEHQPSGGATAHAEPTPPEPDPPLEDAVPPRQTETLFDVPAPPKPPKNPSAADVVAAYIDSFRQAHDGKDPLRRDFLRVGRDARDLLKDGAATVAELTTAATRMGLGEYANLGQELKFTRRDATPGGRGRTPGMAKAASCDDPGWDEIADAFQATTLDPDAQAAWNARFASV